MKLKINWGTGILLFIIAFMIAFTTLLVKSFDEEYDHELVTENYYEKELVFQGQYDKEERLKRTGHSIGVTQLDTALSLDFQHFPDAEGEVVFYRASKMALDRTFGIRLDSNDQLVIPRSQFEQGNYELQIKFSEGDSAYYQAQSISIR